MKSRRDIVSSDNWHKDKDLLDINLDELVVLDPPKEKKAKFGIRPDDRTTQNFE